VILLRSILFNILFYLNLVLHLLIALPTLVLPSRAVVEVAKMWGRVNLWLLRHVCGIGVEWRGLEKIPPGGLIVASKHQSTWDTFALLTILEDPVYVLKRELMWIPVFGWCMRKAGMIPVDRGAGRAHFETAQRRA
jgi:1-acyl-sn-glycerol-3-phosphate acyltransferase